MATEIIASGTTATQSSDIILAGGELTTLILRAPDDLASDYKAAYIEVKDSTGGYIKVSNLTRSDPAKVVSGPVTFRVRRAIMSIAIGVDRE